MLLKHMIGLWSDCDRTVDRTVIGLWSDCRSAVIRPLPRTSLFESVFGGARIFSKLKTPATLHFRGHCFAHFVLDGGAFAFGANAAVMATQEGCCWLWALVGCGAQSSFPDGWAYMCEPFHLCSKPKSDIMTLHECNESFDCQTWYGLLDSFTNEHACLVLLGSWIFGSLDFALAPEMTKDRYRPGAVIGSRYPHHDMKNTPMFIRLHFLFGISWPRLGARNNET